MLINYFGIYCDVPPSTKYISFDCATDDDYGPDNPVIINLWASKPTLLEDESCWEGDQLPNVIELAHVIPTVHWDFSLVELTPAMIAEGVTIQRQMDEEEASAERDALDTWLNDWCRQPNGFKEPTPLELQQRADINWLMRELPGVTISQGNGMFGRGSTSGQVNAPWGEHHGNPLGGMG